LVQFSLSKEDQNRNQKQNDEGEKSHAKPKNPHIGTKSLDGLDVCCGVVL
jgi:hypothetical protein